MFTEIDISGSPQEAAKSIIAQYAPAGAVGGVATIQWHAHKHGCAGVLRSRAQLHSTKSSAVFCSPRSGMCRSPNWWPKVARLPRSLTLFG